MSNKANGSSGSKNRQHSQNIYEILNIESSREMFIKARVAASISTKMKTKNINTRTAANKAKITEKKLKAILSGRFHEITLFRLKRIEYRI